MRTITSLLAAGLVFSATSAFAATASNDQKQAPAAKAAGGAPADAKYCIDSDPGTGSLIKIRDCKTRAQWAREGVEIEATAKPQR